MTDSRPLVCGESMLLPLQLLVKALDMEREPGAADLTDVIELSECLLQQQHLGAHHGLVMELDGPDTGAVWVVWTDGGTPFLIVHPDCPGETPDGREGCGAWEDHPGGHTFELHDPRMASARAIASALLWTHPGTGYPGRGRGL
jgi:hypothetical protein